MRRVLFMLVCLLVTACGGSTPTAKAVTAESVIAAFKAAGLEAENPAKMSREQYGMAPFVCEGVRFVIPSLGKAADGGDKGGRAFVCPNAADRDKLSAYYQELGKSSAMLYSHVFVKGNALVQINGELKDEAAKKYEAAMP